MKISLSINDRLTLNGLLPTEEDMLTLRTIRKLREELSFAEKEIKSHNIRIVETVPGKGHRYAWDSDFKKDIEIGMILVGIISKALLNLNQNKKLTDQHEELYKIFVEDKPTEQPVEAKK